MRKTRRRRRALTVLGLLGLPLVVTAVPGCSGMDRNVDFVQNLYDVLSGNTAGSRVRKMEDTESADKRRQGIYGLISRRYGRAAPYTTRYQQIALADQDYL